MGWYRAVFGTPLNRGVAMVLLGTTLSRRALITPGRRL